jgi:hypothetical protein
MLIVAMGWPHVLLGFAFALGRVLRGDVQARISFAFLVFHVTFSFNLRLRRKNEVIYEAGSDVKSLVDRL